MTNDECRMTNSRGLANRNSPIESRDSAVRSPQFPVRSSQDDLLLRGATIIDPGTGKQRVADIRIRKGVVEQLGRRLPMNGAEIWELPGKFITPGFIDLHCHLREPGREDEETIRSGTLSALAGGFTRVCCMPNTEPAIDNENIVRAIVNESERWQQARVLPIGAATKGRQGAELAEFGAMKNAGAIAVSDDGNPIANPEIMRRVLEYAKTFDLVVTNHCEEKTMTRDGVMNEGTVSARLGLPGMPACAEEMMVARDILLAGYTGGRLHVAHVSTKGSVELIRRAKAQGIPVTGETCPHYFTLTDVQVAGYDPNFKMNPPLRTEADRMAIKEGLSDGTIDAIATDHAPHLASEKEVEFSKAPFGIIGFETAFSLGIEELVTPGFLTLAQYLAKLSACPAQILGLPSRIREGEQADLVVFDPALEWDYTPEAVFSQSRNTPFLGRRLFGKVLYAIIGNRTFRF
jgi:dihydroorotase